MIQNKMQYFIAGLLFSLIPIQTQANPSAPLVGPSGTVWADQSQVVVEPGAVGSTTVFWSTTGAQNVLVTVSLDGAPETNFGGEESGSDVATWIQPNHRYVFRLYEGPNSTNLLRTFTVFGVLPEGSITSSRTSVFATPNQAGTIDLSWQSNSTTGEVYVSINGAAEKPVSGYPNVSQFINWIILNNSYEFRFYYGTSHSYLLDSVTVVGEGASGDIDASPKYIQLTSGQYGATTLTWESNGTPAQVRVSQNGGPETLFSALSSGSKVDPTIQVNQTYNYRLYAGPGATQLLDSVTVQGIEPLNITGTISATPSTFTLYPGEYGTVTLNWTHNSHIQTELGHIRIRENDGPDFKLTDVYGPSGVKTWTQLRDGFTYEFSLYAGLTKEILLDTSTITISSAYGFSDSRLLQARARTEFHNNEIPNLTLDPGACEYITPPPGAGIINPTACNDLPTTPYAAVNGWEQNGGFSSPDYWVLGMNTEFNPWSTCNTGPPNMSEPNSGINFSQGIANGRYGFQMRNDPLEGFWRAHLYVNNGIPGPQNPCLGDPILAPWLSIGAHEGQGNPTPVGVLNPTSPGSATSTRFTAKLWDYDESSEWADFYVYALTNWGGKNRGILIRIVHEGSLNTGSNNLLNRLWNWPVLESMYYPGNDWAFFDAQEIANSCPNLIQEIPRIRPCGKETKGSCNSGQDIEYIIDWQALFECASDQGLFLDPLPTNQDNIPIQGVHWAVENAGNSERIKGGNSLWMSVHDMRMVPSPQ